MSQNTQGIIYLIPSALGEEGIDSIPETTKKVVFSIAFFIVENERSARRFLRAIGYTKNFDEVTMIKIERDEDFIADQLLHDQLEKGKNVGVLSEAGSPGIADPGSAVVRWAHAHHIKVVPLVGPSSIFLAMMSSGLNGQHFAFHGYLPVSSAERKNKLKQLEEESHRRRQTQIFMETPYRNEALLKDILEVCRPDTFLCIASAITLPEEKIFTQRIREWKKNLPDIKKKPTIFLMLTE